MNIKELQKEIKEVENQIIRKGGEIDNPQLLRILKINEELGELCDILLRLLVKTRKGEKLDLESVKEKIAGELVDTITPLIGIANIYRVDLEEAFKKKFKVNKERYEKI